MENTFGQLMRSLRRSKNVSQRDLAEQVGVDFSYISKLENDRLPPPSAETIIRISEVLDVPSEFLLATSGKVSIEVKGAMTASTEAVRFLQEATTMNLKDDEWKTLFRELKKLR